MKPSEALNKNRLQIRQIVASHHASNARVFGSVANGSEHTSSSHDHMMMK